MKNDATSATCEKHTRENIHCIVSIVIYLDVWEINTVWNAMIFFPEIESKCNKCMALQISLNVQDDYLIRIRL